MSSSTYTVPDGVTAVIRLALLTVIPKMSPSRETTRPWHSPTRTAGRISSSAMASTRSRAIADAAATSVWTKSTSSPTVLMTRPPCSVMTSLAISSNRCTTRASWRSLIRRTSEVNDTRSAKPTARSGADGSWWTRGSASAIIRWSAAVR